MMDLDKVYGYDPDRALKGVWVDHMGGQLRIAMIGTAEYQRVVNKYTTAKRAMLRRDQAAAVDEITILTLAESILLDWRNLRVSGEEIPYSRENAVRLLRKYPQFKSDVEAYAGDQSLFSDAQDSEDDGKNSLTTSAGN